jgi:hypothetical protein
MAREGRGRLSSLDLLPEEAQDDLVWALGQLNERKRTQADILFELNDRLEAKSVEGVSKSAFNRKAVAISRAAARMAEQRAIFAGVADHLSPENIDQGNVALGEFLKTLIAEIVSRHEDGLSPKEAMELARGFQSAVSAQQISSKRRSHVEAEREARANAEKTAAAVGAVAQKAGLSAATVDKLKSEILGIQRAA